MMSKFVRIFFWRKNEAVDGVLIISVVARSFKDNYLFRDNSICGASMVKLYVFLLTLAMCLKTLIVYWIRSSDIRYTGDSGRNQTSTALARDMRYPTNIM